MTQRWHSWTRAGAGINTLGQWLTSTTGRVASEQSFKNDFVSSTVIFKILCRGQDAWTFSFWSCSSFLVHNTSFFGSIRSKDQKKIKKYFNCDKFSDPDTFLYPFQPQSLKLCSGNTGAEAVFPKAHWAAAGNALLKNEVEWGHKKARQRWSMCGGGGRISVRTTRLSSGLAIHFRVKERLEAGEPFNL